MKAYDKNLYVLGAGPIAFGAALLNFSPNGMSFDEYFDVREDMSYKDKIVSFSIGLIPALLQTKYVHAKKFDLKGKGGPSSSVSVHLCTGIVCYEAMNVILKRRKVFVAPHYAQFDAQLLRLKRGYVLWGNRNPVQRLKRWYVGKYLF